MAAKRVTKKKKAVAKKKAKSSAGSKARKKAAKPAAKAKKVKKKKKSASRAKTPVGVKKKTAKAPAKKRPTAAKKPAKKTPRPKPAKKTSRHGTVRRKKRPVRAFAPSELKVFRERIVQRQQELLQAYYSAKGDSRRREADGTEDYIDYAVNSYNREFLLSLSELEKTQLQLMDEAIRRIDRGESYGLCFQCDTPIPPRRLEVQPWAKYCLTCQELEEQGLLEERELDDDDDDEPAGLVDEDYDDDYEEEEELEAEPRARADRLQG